MSFRVYEVGAVRLASFFAGDTGVTFLYDLVWLNNTSRVRRVEVIVDPEESYDGRGKSNFMFREGLRKFLNEPVAANQARELNRVEADEALRAVGLESYIENPTEGIPLTIAANLQERHVMALESIATSLKSISDNLNVNNNEGSFGALMHLLERKL